MAMRSGTRREKEMSPRVRTWQSDPRATAIPRRTALLAGAALPLGLMIGKTASATVRKSAPSPRLTLPPPTGSHRLGTTSLYLIDPSRPDAWVPNQRAQVMIQLWYPAEAVDGYPRAPYMPTSAGRAWEKNLDLPSLNLPITEGHLGAPVRRRDGGWPVVLYSHSLGGERSETTSLVTDLASRGYVVVTIDHIHDADVVELPDGSLQFCAVPPPTVDKDTPTQTKEIVSRVADVRFVLDQLAVINCGGNPGHEQWPLPRGLRGALDLGRVGMFGQSDGGSTTAHAMNADARIKVGVSLDGTLWTPQAEEACPAARSCCSGGRTWTPSRRAPGPRSGRPIAALDSSSTSSAPRITPSRTSPPWCRRSPSSSASQRAGSSKRSAPSTGRAWSPSSAPISALTSTGTFATATAPCSPGRRRATPRSGSLHRTGAVELAPLQRRLEVDTPRDVDVR